MRDDAGRRKPPGIFVSSGQVHLRVPAHDGHDSGLMADSVPEAWRTVFRPDGGHFPDRSGTVSALTPERCPR
jgi:hypothetical protein